ncbi:MAG: hypothetical protein WBY94_11830 [Polyangiaceae bacterium]
MRSAPRAISLVLCAACTTAGARPTVRAPSPRTAPSQSFGLGNVASTGRGPEGPSACGAPWTLDLAGGDARVVVICANDVRREAFDESSVIARSLSPALIPARERVCACAGRVRPPPFVDLVFTAKPEEGKVTVRAGDEDLDPELGPPFVACVGALVATFTPLQSGACPEAGRASFVFPVRLELGAGE